MNGWEKVIRYYFVWKIFYNDIAYNVCFKSCLQQKREEIMGDRKTKKSRLETKLFSLGISFINECQINNPTKKKKTELSTTILYIIIIYTYEHLFIILI